VGVCDVIRRGLQDRGEERLRGRDVAGDDVLCAAGGEHGRGEVLVGHAGAVVDAGVLLRL